MVCDILSEQLIERVKKSKYFTVTVDKMSQEQYNFYWVDLDKNKIREPFLCLCLSLDLTE